MNVQVKIINAIIGKDERFPLPTRATDGSAGIDLRACIDAPLTIKADESVLVGTGLAIYIQNPDYVGLIMPRSGLGHKHGIVLGNLTGVIDADYMNSRFVKYIKLINQTSVSEELVTQALDELHKTFAMLSQDEQKYAVIAHLN